jgi:hypothetical protein
MIIQQVAVHYVKFGVWCAASAAGITRTIFFNETTTSHWNAQHMLTPVSEQLSDQEKTLFFFKLGQCIRSLGKQFYALLSQYILWQNHKQWPHLPDMNVCDFYLWRVLKDKIYSNDLHT